MRGSVRRLLVVGLAWGVAGLASAPGTALGEGSPSGGTSIGEGSGASSLLSGSLVISGSPVEGEQAQAQEQAKLASPEAVVEREASRAEFEGLNTEQAAKVAGEAFPAVIDEPTGGSPKLPAGQSITGYLTDDAAQVDLPEGKHGVIESIAPIAVESSSGQREPIDLSLNEVGGAFEPKTPAVPVSIPKHLGSGVALASTGVSLTPVDGSGAPLGGSEGVVDGATVLYGNTQTDMDSLVKPTTAGFEADTLLRSVESPQQLFFRVGLPSGASLVQANDGSGVVEVVEEGTVIATILPPGAQDAAGTSVPVSMSISGDTLTLSVAYHAAEYQYPIAVDPEVNDHRLVEENGKERSNWKFESSSETEFGHEPDEGPHKDEGPGKGYLETKGVAEYPATGKAFWAYETQGVSKIYELSAIKTEGKNKGAEIESFLELEHGGTQENKEQLSTETKNPEYGLESASPLCAKNGEKVECGSPAAGTAGNTVRFQQSAQKAPGNYKFSDSLHEGIVHLSEPAGTHSTTSENTTTPEFEVEVEKGGKKEKQTRKNALDGTKTWLSEYDGALQFIAKDTGIGVSKSILEYESSPGSGKWEQLPEHNYLPECQGMQCSPEQKEFWTLNTKLPNGEDNIRYRAEEAMGDEKHETESLTSEGTATVKVDDSKPHGILIGGLPYGNELGERHYELTVYVTDGEGPTIASSGVKSTTMSVDGKSIEDNEVKKKETKEAGKKEGECAVPKGECIATAKYSIEGAELGAGHHSIQVVAFDNAGNEGRLPGGATEISVRHSTPVAVGPGSLDLESGDFSFGASDVAMGSGLTLSRAYSSRATEEGDEGPLGPEWSMSMASTESLAEIPDGSLLMTLANGSQTIFAAPLAGVKCESKAPFESPPGDSNLNLWCEENKTTKVREAYYLEDAADHTKVKFTLPTGGTKVWVPTVQEGTAATDTLTYKYKTAAGVNEYAVPSSPWGITSGPGGNLWYTESCCESNAIGEITPTGSKTEFTSLPVSGPTGIAEGSDGNLWFVNSNTRHIDKMTASGKLTEYESPGNGEWGNIAEGPEGDVWLTHEGGEAEYPGTIVKMNTSGGASTYSVPAESNPYDITPGPEGDMWFTNRWCFYTSGRICKIGKITTSGTVTEYPLEKGLPPEDIVAGPNGEQAVWFTSPSSIGPSIVKMTTSGVTTKYALPAKSYPRGITAGPDGNLWFTEWEPGKIGKITPSGTITEYALPEGSKPFHITAGPDGKLWFTEFGTKQIGTITTSGTITEPIEALAPKPSGVSCSWLIKATEMKPGCRALEFKYAEKTKSEIGEGPTEWGEYNRRLMKVSMVAYNPSSKVMEEKAVSEYAYDKLGRLRAEWDPRLTTPLKTTYGYDENGRVTALNPPGQEPWSFTYGTSTGDSGTGRLLKATRAPASESLWGGVAVKNTEAAKITGSPVVGVRLAVSSGKWYGSPLTYGYQWDECNSEGQCTAILGADNANYTPVASNVGRSLLAQVTATNGGGSSVTVTAATAAVTGTSVTQSVDSGNGLNAVSCVPATTDCVLSDSKGSALYSTNVSTTAAATWKAWTGPAGASPSEAVACPASTLCALGDGKATEGGGDMYYATSLGGAWTEAFKPAHGVLAVSCPSSSFCVDAQESGRIRYSAKPASTEWTEVTIGSGAMNGVFCLSSSFCASVNGAGDLYVANAEAKVKEASGWKATDIDGSTTLHGVACTSTTSCVAVDGAGEVLDLTINSSGEATASKHDIDGMHSLSAVTCTGSSTCVTVDNAGNVFGSKNGGETWTKVYALGDELRSVSCASTTLCATVDTTGNVTAFGPAGGTGTEGELHSPGPGTTIDYNVPVHGGEAPYNMSEAEVARWGQKAEETPFEATAIFPPDSPQGWPASSYTRASIDYLDENGRLVNTANPSTGKYGAISTTEYNAYNDVVRTLTPDNRATALEAGETESAKVASLLSTVSQYNEPNCRKETDEPEKEIAEPGTRLCETWGPEHEVKYVAGKETKEALARNHAKYYYEDIANGAPEEVGGKKQAYDLVTETQDLAQWFSAGKSEGEVESRRSTTSYSGQSGLGWTLRAPTSTTAATESEGAKVTHTTLYNKETGQITETRGPEGAGGESAHDKKIIYYSPKEEAEVSACRNRPEWAGLICETLPAKQPPETTGVPKLPEATTTYNMWNEPETIVETFPKSGSFAEYARTTKDEYDTTGRMKTSEETSTATTETADKALPKVTNVYNEKTGVLEKQSTTVGEKTKTITSAYNKLGQMETYTDADGNIAKFKYAAPEKDGLLEEMSDSSDEGTSSQKYTYSTTTKQLTQLVDSAAGTFTASYDTEGKLASEVYPNGMCANYAPNAAGEATHIEYTKTSSCSEKEGVWYSETKVPSARGETMSRTSTLAKEEYAYDTLGRLTAVQETPAGEYCKTRIYSYDEESNRKSLTTREPNGKKECATEGGTEEKHTYDEANRLTDAGMTYDPLGNTTKLPAGDAEGHALESTFYVDNAVATQTQNGVTNDYYMDPDGRVRETITGAKKAITHYDGSGEAIAWTCEGSEKAEKCESGGKWTRNIPGIDGTLTAVQNGTGATVETPILQLHDLQGDVVATIKDKTGETKLESTYNSTEFGVPSGGKEPPKFAWLGAGGVEKSLASGVITEGATSYVPQTGKALQSEEVAPPGLPEGSGGDGPYTFELSPSVMQGATREANEAPAIGAAEEKAAAEAACNANPATCGPEDPEGLASFTTTEKIYAAIMKEANNNALLNELVRFAPSKVLGVLGTSAELISQTYKSWASALAANCLGSYKTNYPWSACWIHVETFGFSATVPVLGIHIEWHIFLFLEGEPCYRPVVKTTPYFFCAKGARDGPWIGWQGGS